MKKVIFIATVLTAIIAFVLTRDTNWPVKVTATASILPFYLLTLIEFKEIRDSLFFKIWQGAALILAILLALFFSLENFQKNYDADKMDDFLSLEIQDCPGLSASEVNLISTTGAKLCTAEAHKALANDLAELNTNLYLPSATAPINALIPGTKIFNENSYTCTSYYEKAKKTCPSISR